MTQAKAKAKQQRFNAAFRDLRTNGVAAKSNVTTVTRGSTSITDDLGGTSADQPYAYTYGGQGCRVSWEDGERAYQRGWRGRREYTDQVYVYFGNGSAQQVVDTFRDHGFEVEWDGKDTTAISVAL